MKRSTKEFIASFFLFMLGIILLGVAIQATAHIPVSDSVSANLLQLQDPEVFLSGIVVASGIVSLAFAFLIGILAYLDGSREL